MIRDQTMNSIVSSQTMKTQSDVSDESELQDFITNRVENVHNIAPNVIPRKKT